MRECDDGTVFVVYLNALVDIDAGLPAVTSLVLIECVVLALCPSRPMNVLPANCQVLGAGPPTVALLDESNPGGGGVSFTFMAIPTQYVAVARTGALVTVVCAVTVASCARWLQPVTGPIGRRSTIASAGGAVVVEALVALSASCWEHAH